MLVDMTISEVLTKNVVQILPGKDALAKLMEKKKITLYLGIDPSNPQIHLGNAVALRKLRQFQDLGHKVILLIGDFTGMIGDPTDKSAARKKITKDEVSKNAKTYKQQASIILDFEGENAAQIKFNSEWLGKLSSYEWIELLSNFTEQQLDERDMYQARKKAGKAVYMHELVYPIMQGYDSVTLDVDLEVGGTDQTFNMLAGRHLTKTLKGKEKFVLTVPLLLGTDGQKMGKSTGNFMPITDAPNEMFGKIMSIRDDMLEKYFELATDINPNSVNLSKPMNAKKRLAFEIVKIYHGEEKAKKAQSEFEKTFQQGIAPGSIPTIKIKNPDIELVDFLVENNLTQSKSEAKRLITQKAIELDGQTVENDKIKLGHNRVMRIGKKKFVRIVIE